MIVTLLNVDETTKFVDTSFKIKGYVKEVSPGVCRFFTLGNQLHLAGIHYTRRGERINNHVEYWTDVINVNPC